MKKLLRALNSSRNIKSENTPSQKIFFTIVRDIVVCNQTGLREPDTPAATFNSVMSTSSSLVGKNINEITYDYDGDLELHNRWTLIGGKLEITHFIGSF